MPKIEDFDVVILGGGINGCGSFRDLCLQGLRCLLIEREDFCAGASAASSRLMHGGLKYLETGEFRLVKESLTERNMLLATAPHVVEPLECVVPVRSTFGGIFGSVARFFGIKARLNDRGFIITALGLRLYDLYGRALRATPTHHMLRRSALRRLLPDLAPEITGAGLYYEGHITHAERLGLELVLDAEAANPQSRAETHAEILRQDNGVLTYRVNGQTHQVRPRVILNAGGAWIDQVNAQIGLHSKLMGGSRGSHLVVDNPALLAALKGRMIYFGTADGRVNLLYPFAGKVLVGATDIAQPDPDAAVCTDDEAAYMCAAVAEVFPNIPILPEQIAYRFCGVRPLPRADGDIGAVTRDHSIATLSLANGTPVHCLIGGKWTTFRGFSEQVTDLVLANLGRPRKMTTAGLAIGGGKDFPRAAKDRAALARDLATLAGITAERADKLLSRYGTRARNYCASLHGKGETPLATLADYSREELAHLIKTERVKTADDLLRRRTLIALTGQDSPALLQEIAALLASAPTAKVAE